MANENATLSAEILAKVQGLQTIEQLEKHLEGINSQLKGMELNFRQVQARIRQLGQGNPQQALQLAGLRGQVQPGQDFLRLQRQFLELQRISKPIKVDDPYNVRELRDSIKAQEKRVLLFKQGTEEHQREKEALQQMFRMLRDAQNMERSINAEVRHRSNMETEILRQQDRELQQLRDAISLERLRNKIRQEGNGDYTLTRREARILSSTSAANDRIATLTDPAASAAAARLRTEQAIIAAKANEAKITRQIADAEATGNVSKVQKLRLSEAENKLTLMNLQGVSRESAEYQAQLSILKQINNERVKAPKEKAPRLDAMLEARAAAMTSEGRGSLLALQGTLLVNYGLLNNFIGGVRSAIQFTVDYEAELRNLQAIVGATDTQLSRLSDTISAVASETKYSVSEIVQGTQVLAQAGFSVSEIEKSLGPIVKFASATGTELKTAVDIVTTTITAFNLTVDDTERIANTFTAALNASKLSIEQLTLGFQYAANIAAQSGVTFTEMTAVLGGMANAGIRSGSTLGTGFRQVLMELQNPSEEFQKRIANLGLTMADLDVRTYGIVAVFEKLRAAGFTSADALASFETRTAAAAIAIENQIDTIRRLEVETSMTNAATEANEKQMEALRATYTTFTNTLQVMVSDALEPMQNALQGVVKWLTEMLKGVNTAHPVVQAFVTMLVTAFGGLIISTIAGTIGAFLRFSGVVISLSGSLSGLGIAMGGLATGSLTLAGAFRTATAALGGLPGLVITVISVLAGLATGFGLLDDKMDAFEQAAEDAATKQQNLKDELNSGNAVMSSIQESINRIIDRYDQLEKGSAALKSEMYALSSQFGALGLNIDMAADSADTLIQKLIQLQGAQAGANAVAAMGIAQTADASINAEGGIYASRQADIYNLLSGYAARQKGVWGKPNTGESASTLNSLNDLFSTLGISDTSQLTSENIGAMTTNRGVREKLRKIRKAAAEAGDAAALEILNGLENQFLSLTKINGQIVTRDAANRTATDNKTIQDTVTSPAYAEAQRKFLELRQTSREVQSEVLKLTDPMEAGEFFQTRKADLEKQLAALESQAEALGDDFLNAPGVTLRSDIAALKSEINNMTRTVTTAAGEQAVKDAKAEVEVMGKELALAIQQQRRGTGAGRMDRDVFVSNAERLRKREVEQALADTGLRAMIDSGAVDPTTLTVKEGQKIPARYAQALRAFRAEELVALNGMQDRIEDYDDATKKLSDSNGRAGAAAGRKQASLLFTRLNTLRKRIVDGSEPNVVADTQQEAISLIESMLGVSLSALKDKLNNDPTAFISESDFGSLDELTRAKLVAFFDSVRKGINASLEELLRQQEEETRKAAFEEATKRKLLSQGYDEYQRTASAQATVYSNLGAPDIFSRAASATATKAGQTAYALSQGALTKDRVDLLTRHVQELTTWLSQAEVQMQALEARQAGGDYTVETQISELRKEQATATDDLTKKTEALDAANAELAATTNALANAEKLRNGTLGEAAQLTVDAWLEANKSTQTINETLSETLTAGLDAARSGFGSFFRDIATGAKSAGEAFQDLATTILDAMLQVVVSELATQFLELIIGSFSSGGIVPGAPKTLTPVKKYVQGGFIRAAQGFSRPISTRDSVPILAQPGEAIIRSSAVSMIGEEGIRQMNALGNRKVSGAAAGLPPPPPPREKDEVNVWVVSKDRVPTLGPNDVLAIVNENIANGGSIKQQIKRVQVGG